MITVDELRPLSLFDGVGDDQLAELVAHGTEIAIEPGAELFHEGGDADAWWLLLDGAVDLVRNVGGEDTVVRRMDLPGQWAGGFRAWDDGGRYLATGRGARPGRMLQVQAPALRELSLTWFPFAVHLIEGLYSTARSIESTARHRESLVTLGTLAAGLAHEINNPAAAAVRAVESLDTAAANVLTAVQGLAAAQVSAEDVATFDRHWRELEPSAVGVDPLDRADLEERLTDWLEDHRIERAWRLAATLAAAGADVSWCDEVADAVAPASLGPGIAWMASTAETAQLLDEVKVATNRVSALVTAVRSYSQVNRGEHQQVDVTEGIESSLLVLGHKLRGGIVVTRDFADGLPSIDANAGELNQVWTNLVDNAVDAMDGRGTLRISTREVEDGIEVTFADSGPAVADAVLARAFDAFYTTKDVGKGTGLGLDIARRVVAERHRGAIALAREGEETVARVRLPLG
ncbi:ATP-binding protein [Mumia qirimensis]|uniref:ATP-binding protein n=1 Tax=Mumia qirimensis TaxID=3234852 RepID=UPI00351DA0DF